MAVWATRTLVAVGLFAPYDDTKSKGGKVMRFGWQQLMASSLALVAVASIANKAHAEWETKCSLDRMTDKQRCSMGQTVWAASRTAYIIVGYEGGHLVVGGDGRPVQARIRVDSGEAVTTTDCPSAFCFVPERQKKALLDKMRSGSRLLVEVTQANGKVIGPLEVSLSGFDQAYQKMK